MADIVGDQKRVLLRQFVRFVEDIVGDEVAVVPSPTISKVFFAMCCVFRGFIRKMSVNIVDRGGPRRR